MRMISSWDMISLGVLCMAKYFHTSCPIQVIFETFHSYYSKQYVTMLHFSVFIKKI